MDAGEWVGGDACEWGRDGELFCGDDASGGSVSGGEGTGVVCALVVFSSEAGVAGRADIGDGGGCGGRVGFVVWVSGPLNVYYIFLYL